MATKTEVPKVADRLLDFYRRPAPMTSPGRFAPMFDELPRDVVGIFKGDLRGLWFAADNLVHDVANLNKMEMLQWDAWGAMPRPDERLDDDRLAFFDRLVALTRAPDEAFEELRALYQGDERLRVPATVFNSLLNRPEPV